MTLHYFLLNHRERWLRRPLTHCFQIDWRRLIFHHTLTGCIYYNCTTQGLLRELWWCGIVALLIDCTGRRITHFSGWHHHSFISSLEYNLTISRHVTSWCVLGQSLYRLGHVESSVELYPGKLCGISQKLSIWTTTALIRTGIMKILLTLALPISHIYLSPWLY